MALMDILESQNKAITEPIEANSGESEMEARKRKVEQEGEARKRKVEQEGEASKCPSSYFRPSSLPMGTTGGQLTIFYNRAFSVYNGITPEKAQALMLIAAASAVSATTATKIPVGAANCLSQQSSSGAAVAGGNASSLCKLQHDLPIARRQSLQQFLEKRRNRSVSKAPYAIAKNVEEGVEAGMEGKLSA